MRWFWQRKPEGEGEEPKLKRGDIIRPKKDYHDGHSGRWFYDDNEAKVLAASGTKIEVEFGFRSSCPFARYRVKMDSKLVKKVS